MTDVEEDVNNSITAGKKQIKKNQNDFSKD